APRPRAVRSYRRAEWRWRSGETPSAQDGRFSLCRSHHLRHLHSFPTRRSSDLAHQPADQGECGERGDHRDRYRDPTRPLPRRPRSEEHTSELQSRFDLVCRLLLEKKNAAEIIDPAMQTSIIATWRVAPRAQSMV